jgi:hypothetical protein
VIDSAADVVDVELAYDEGTDVYVRRQAPEPGARSEELRVLRSRAEAGALRLLLEGRAGRSYELGVRTRRTLAAAPGATVRRAGERDFVLEVAFEATGDGYVRREVVLPMR